MSEFKIDNSFDPLKSYLLFYEILNVTYFSIKNNYQSLGISYLEFEDYSSFMGNLNPNIFGNGVSADPAYYEDWKEIYNKNVEKYVNYERLIITFKSFIRYYNENFNMELLFLNELLDSIDQFTFDEAISNLK